MTERYDSKNLRTLADWFDSEQKTRPEWADNTQVQQDLRRIAAEIEQFTAKLAEKEAELAEAQRYAVAESSKAHQEIIELRAQNRKLEAELEAARLSVKDDVGWLIEYAEGKRAQWWDGFGPVIDSTLAVRFSRKQDAEKVIEFLKQRYGEFSWPDYLIATEHLWVSSEPKEAKEPR